MADNADLSADLLIDKIENSKEQNGYNFRTDEMVDLYDAGIMDPAKVTRVALLNAVSVASILITTNHAIVEI